MTVGMEYSVAATSTSAPLGVFTTLGRLRIANARAGDAPADEWREIEGYAGRLCERYRHSADPVLLMAECLAARHDFDRAAKLLREEAGKKLHDPRLWVALASVAEQSEGRRVALEVLDEAQGIIGDQAELRLARGQLWAKDPELRRAGRLRDLERGLEDLGDAEQLRLIAGLADLNSNIRDGESLKRMYRLLAARRPSDVAVHVALLEALVGDADGDERGRVEAEVRRLEGEESLTLRLLALRRSADGAAVATALDIVKEHPDRADAHFTLARLAERDGDVKTAGSQYSLAVERDRSNLRYLQAQLGFLLKHESDNTARQMLARLYFDPRLTAERFEALFKGSLSDVPDASVRRCLAWLGSLADKDPRVLLWLAEFLARTKRIEEALAMYRRATVAAPKLPETWIGLLSLLAGEKTQEWRQELGKAKAALPAERFYLVCATCADAFRKANPGWQPSFEKPGDRRLFAQARVELAISRGDRKQAAELLEELIADHESRPEDVEWAKRTAAMLTLQSGTPEEGRAAFQAIRKDSAAGHATLEERRGRAALLLTAYRQLPGPDRRAALAELTETLRAIAGDQEATAKDWFLLAQVQRQAGDRDGYRRSLHELVRREPDNLFYASAYADELLAANDLKAAEIEIAKLRQAVHDLRAVASVARFYCVTNMPSRSLEVVERYVQIAEPGSLEASARVRQAAALLDQVARLAAEKEVPSAQVFADAAVERYRAAVRIFPEDAERFAALLGYLNQTAAAIEVIEQNKARLSARAVAAAGLAVLRTGNANPRQFIVVKQWMDAAAAEQPGSVAPQLQLAEYHTLRQDFVAAENVYRAILRSDADHVVALNNLAWVLAARPEKSTESLALVERAMRVGGATGELLDTRARILIAAGKYDRAVDDLNDALNQAPTSLRYFHLAVARLKQSKRDEAVEAFKRAKDRGLDPKAIHPSDLPAYKVFTSEVGG